MKILSIRIYNINSLKGKFEVDFTGNDLSPFGIFGITGATGSGKSTILDCICLALYNQTPRTKHGRNSIPNPKDYLSRLETEAWTEVVFEVEDQQYCARWSVQKARKKIDGKIQDSQLKLSFADTGELLTTGKKVDHVLKVEEITGLNFEQFTRSLLLAQGEFAAFLKATENERASLLTKITGGEIFKKLGSKSFEKSNEFKHDLANLEAVSSGYSFKSPEELEQLQQSLKKAGVDLLTLSKQKGEWDLAQQWRDSELSLLKKFQEHEMESVRIQSDRKQQESLEIKLAKGKKALKILPLAQQLQELEKELKDLQERGQKLSGQRLQKGDEKRNRENLYQNLEREIEKAKEESKKIRPLLIQAAQLDEKKELFQQEYQKSQKDYIEQQHQQEKFKRRILDIKQDILTLKRQQVENEQWLLEQQKTKNLQGNHSLILQLHQTVLKLRDQYRIKQSEGKNLKRELLQKEEGAQHQQLGIQPLLDRQGKFQGELQVLQKWIEQSSEKRDGIDLTEKIEREQEKLFALKDAEAYFQRVFELEPKCQTLETHFQQIQERKIESGKRQEQLKVDLFVLQNRLEELVILRDQFRAQKELSEQRAQLKEGDPCPLCGALQHPLEGKSQEEVDEKFQLYDQELRESEEKKRNWEGEGIQLRETLKNLSQEGERLGQEIKEWEEEKRIKKDLYWKIITLLFPEQKEFGSCLIHYEVAQKNLEDWKKRQRESQQKRERYQQLLENQTQIQQQLEDKNRIFQQAQQEINVLKNNIENCIKELDDLKRQGVKEREILQENAERSGINLPEKSEGLPPFSLFQQELQEKILVYEKKLQLQEQIQLEQVQKKEKLDSFEEQFREMEQNYQKRKEDLDFQIQQLQQFSLERDQIFQGDFAKQSVKEIETRLEEKEDQLGHSLEKEKTLLEEARQALQTVQLEETEVESVFKNKKESEQKAVQHFHQSLEKEGFQGNDDFKKAYHDENELIQWERSIEGKKKEFQKIQALILDTQRVLENHRQSSPSVQDWEEHQREGGKLERSIHSLQEQTGRYKAELEQHQKNREKFGQLHQKMDEVKKQYHRWEQIRIVIGDREGNTFSKFAQHYTLKKLVYFANKHLKKLSGRYSIHTLDDEKQLMSFEVIDHYQADVRRPVSMLSGGESFLLSLALALALSDLASGKTRIQSLFIDEGFGALDEDSLDVVMSCLEQLQATGRKIGIISHVEALKEKLPVRIHLSKLADGNSRMTIH